MAEERTGGASAFAAEIDKFVLRWCATTIAHRRRRRTTCARYYEAASQRGALFVGVCRGKVRVSLPRCLSDIYLILLFASPRFDELARTACACVQASEGIDFADQNGRAVVITGLPYANRHSDAKVRARASLRRVVRSDRRRRVQVQLKIRYMDEQVRQRAASSSPAELLDGNSWHVRRLCVVSVAF